MQSYPIHELERLTGVKAHTIRIWEKRYNLITPDRTETNRRFYNDDQVRKLLNVTTLLGMGLKISKIAAFSDEEINAAILGVTTNEQFPSVSIAFINDLVKTMMNFDEAGFEKIFSAAVTRFGIYEAMLQVIYPFLNKVGVLWTVERTAPVQEHFASHIVRRKLMAAVDGLLPATEKKKFLLFLPEGEWHEIGLLFAHYIIRQKGYDAIYLGQSVPFRDISKVLSIVKPDFILLFFIVTIPPDDVLNQLNALNEFYPLTKILVSGNAEILQPCKTLSGQITYLPEVKSLLEYL